MSYYPKGHHHGDDDVKEFEEYDSTPYGGGYDITLTYGRPLPPSDDTCYPNSSSSSSNFDSDRPQYSSYSEPSAYGDDALDNEYKSYVRPKPRPAASHGSGGGGEGYGRRPEYERPSSEYGGGSAGYRRQNNNNNNNEYEEKSGYRKQNEYEEKSGSEYGGSGYGRKTRYGEDEEGEYRKATYNDDDGGYAPKKYGDDNSDDDEEKKYRKHHHRKHYDD